jgi:hypothetical protein
MEEDKKLKAQKQAEKDALPHKGKPAWFFLVEKDSDGIPQPTEDLQEFIFKYYPTYADPEDLVNLANFLKDYATSYERALTEEQKA